MRTEATSIVCTAGKRETCVEVNQSGNVYLTMKWSLTPLIISA